LSSRNLVLRAGARAAERLREEGLRPDAFDTLVGASGGPKWLVLRHLDEALIERLILPRRRPLDLLGSSIGSFRHACFAQADPSTALARFAESYAGQAYEGRPTMETISHESQRILDDFLGDSGASEVASNEMIRSHVIATRFKKDRGHDRGLAFQIQLAHAAALNVVSRRLLERALSRVHFASVDPGEASIAFDDFKTLETQLSKDNLRHALLASGSIPLVMAGVRSLPEVSGTLFDGGIIDYHFDFGFRRRDGLVLFPHFFDRITPGWFDKPLRWRRPPAANLDDVVLLAPSDEFVASLPGGRVPDRNDFLELETQERFRRWDDVMNRCRVLADELCDLFDAADLGDRIEPFSH